MCASPSVSDCQSQRLGEDAHCRQRLPETLLSRLRLELNASERRITRPVRGFSAPARQQIMIKLQPHQGDETPVPVQRRLSLLRPKRLSISNWSADNRSEERRVGKEC